VLAFLSRFKFGAFVILVAVLFIVAKNEVNSIRNVVKENLNAVARLSDATRLDREFLHFVNLARARYDGTPNVTSQDVQTSFDLLWSRVDEQLDITKTVGVKALEDGMGMLKELSNGLTEIDPAVHHLGANDVIGMRAINQFDARYGGQVYHLVQRAYEEMTNRSVNAAAAQRATAQTIERLQWVFLLVGAIGFLMLRSELQGIRKLNEELTRQEAEIQNFAYTDSLTNLSNRRHFDEQMSKVKDGLTGTEAHLLLIDLDGFKLVNDRHGHSVGDELLSEVALRLRRAVGEASVLARIGGDEFGVIINGSEVLAQAAAATILAILQGPIELEQHTVFIDACIGISGTRGRVSCASALMREADKALYTAKAEGRGKFRVFSDTALPKQSASIVSLVGHSKRRKPTPA
jgi:diguanylate cyclase (GGDEF)-like protein